MHVSSTTPFLPPGQVSGGVESEAKLEPAFSLAERPLKQQANFSEFTIGDFTVLSPAKGPCLMHEDAEPDDCLAVCLYRNEPLFIVAEPHKKRENGLERTQKLLQLLRKELTDAVEGGDKSTANLLKRLNGLEDGSLRILVIAPAPTLQALIQTKPNLLAKKQKRIVWLGPPTKRLCEHGKFSGKEVYYTNHNASAHLDAARSILKFAELNRVSTYLLSTDNLKLERYLNFDTVHKISSLDIPASRYLLEDIIDWNQKSVKGKRKEKLEKLAKKSGYKALDIMRKSMTPADAIAAVFDLYFDHLEIKSRGVANVNITNEPRYEMRDGSWQPTKHRAMTFDFSEESTVRLVDEFRLKGTKLSTTRTFESLLNYSLNGLWYQQKKGEEAKDSQAKTPTLSAAKQTATLAAAAIPKTLSLRVLAQANPEIDISSVQIATEKEIKNALKNDDYFSLQALFKATVVAEFVSSRFNYALRSSFMDAFATMQSNLKPLLEKKEFPADLSQPKRKELERFLQEGRGAESVRIFAKILVPIRIDDPKYPKKLMMLAKNKWHMRANDMIPGTKDRLDLEKTDILLEESLLLDERRVLQIQYKESALKQMQQLSSSLNGHRFYRGVIGSGKTTFAFEQHGLDEAKLVTPDTMKEKFGGLLSHHECCSLMDDLRDQTKDLAKVDMRTNVYERNAADFAKLKGPKEIHDIHVSLETAKGRVAFRAKNEGGRPAGDEEIEKQFREALVSRPDLIKEAFKNPQASWHLYDNNDSSKRFRKVAQIIKGQLQIKDERLFQEMLKEAKFKAAIKAGPAPEA